MTDIEKKPSRLDLVRAGQKFDLPRTGRMVVGIEKIAEDPHNERKVFRNMDGLIESVKAMGVIEPITVTALESGLYQIITGHRRYRAAKIAGLPQIEVLIREPDEERVRRQKSIVSNVQREDIGPVEMAEALQSLLDDDNEIDSQDKLAGVIGKDKTWVSRILRILDLPTPLRAKVATSQLSIPYDAVASIARLNDVSLQEQLIDELLAGGSVRTIRDRIQEHKGVVKNPSNDEKTRSDPKPKQVFHTAQKATVIIQSETKQHLSSARTIAALQEALKAARKSQAD